MRSNQTLRKCIVGLVISGVTIAPANAAPRKATQPKQSAPLAVDPETDDIRSLRRTDLKALFATLSAVPKKGEFETSDDYRLRLSTLAGQWYAIEVRAEVFSLSYDADRQSFKLDALGGPVHSLDAATGLDDLLLLSASSKPSHYSGSTAFGAKVRVTKRTDTAWGIAFPSLGFNRSLRLLVPVSSDRARDVKANLRVLLVCRLAPLASGPALATSEYSAPEYSTPYEITTSEKLIPIDAAKIIVYDGASGKVLARKNAIEPGKPLLTEY